MKWLSRYLRPLLLVEEAMPWFLPVIGAVFLSLLANLIYEVVKTYVGFVGTLILLVALLVVSILFIAAYSLKLDRSRKVSSYKIWDKPCPSKKDGLVILVSRKEVVEKAIDYHLPQLKHCWLITTPESAPIAAEIQQKYKGSPACHPRDIANEYDTDGCFDAVKHIFAQDLPRFGLGKEQVIADITGGTKPMTAALVVASLSGGYAIEHIPTQYRREGDRRVPNVPLDPIEIAVQRRQEQQEGQG